MEPVELQCNNELKLKFHAEIVSLLACIKNILNANTIPATSNPNGLLRQKLCQYRAAHWMACFDLSKL